uniref:HL02309p n=1 Tax=Drosophila melanogaster TaxID=7227 RepID=Q7YXW1_DROME|nr:HL02309p [Drosophila melanogaster]
MLEPMISWLAKKVDCSMTRRMCFSRFSSSFCTDRRAARNCSIVWAICSLLRHVFKSLTGGRPRRRSASIRKPLEWEEDRDSRNVMYRSLVIARASCSAGVGAPASTAIIFW